MEPMDRRTFIKQGGGVLGGVAALAAPGILQALGADEKLVFGVIGCGGRGTGHVNDLVKRSEDPQQNLAVAAVCEVYRPRLENARKIAKAEGYLDYKELLARKDIHCVVIATPDHWHAPMAIEAMKAGKDVYLEKPMTRTWQEAREVYRTAMATGRVLQVGTQHTEDGSYWTAAQAIRDGEIGKIIWSQISYSRNSTGGEWNYKIDEDSSPENLDWSRWLGSAPQRPFSRERFFRFRKYWDYSGGIATDLHYHKLAPILIALGPEFPYRVTSGGGVWMQKDGREVPDTFMTIIDMPGEHTIMLASSMASSQGLPDVIRGNQATLYFRGGVEIVAEGPYRKAFEDRHEGKDRIHLEPKKRENHMQNFISCVRSRKWQDLNCNVELGYKTMVAIAMSVEAYRQNKVLFWDAKQEEVVDREPARQS